MYKIVICIPTYKRPAGLEKLLHSILKSNLDVSLIREVFIIIVDNDEYKTAENIFIRVEKKSDFPFSMAYHNYTEKGLANIRNELFRIALQHDPDYIVSIDDDEFVTQEWLNELITTIVSTKGDLVAGPVIPSFNVPVPDHISCWFIRHNHLDKERIYIFRAGNYVIDVEFLKKQKLKFDDRFNTRGSEDSFFGHNALKKGAKIYWARNAVAYESIPKERANLIWLMKRRFRGGNNFMYKLIIEKLYLKTTRKIVISLFYIIIGLISLFFMLFPSKYRFFGLLKISEGVGSLSGLLNIRSEGYK